MVSVWKVLDFMLREYCSGDATEFADRGLRRAHGVHGRIVSALAIARSGECSRWLIELQRRQVDRTGVHVRRDHARVSRTGRRAR